MEEQQKFGFTRFAEVWNGRLAMIGFTAGVIVEMITGQGILSQIGLM
ncbi:MAG: high light inducible protein [Leptolyngbyaceae cyanobacterium SM1_1_3]|nr:high light inducible protein [Leptolyngbyaceae cyanobacterium SM1_1_3]NJN02748.1 high light inducible protein [Leptolyngbyaceae cyanobacterium RM1_1_2]NJO09297.1 high light inducible protein [Leptolyngbyaceae cyanobacterium SL_1_1]NJO53050.1 high light inducible protein [Leptolyngbyaceae cyanobacterium RM2_2_4]